MNTKILYLEAAKREFVDRFLIDHPGFYYRSEDGKITSNKHMIVDPPWAYFKMGYNQNCAFWSGVLFDCVFKKQRVPIQCQNCWKVVLMPRDIEELFASYLLLRELNRPGKCGTEGDRPNTDRLYGAYWYNNSVEEGLEAYNLVKAQIEKDRFFEATILDAPLKVRFGNGYDGPPRLILKRGCTEFEQACGPSDKWGWDDDQVEMERIAADAFSQDIVNQRQGDIQLARLAYVWIHKAFRWGDKKYTMFTNGNRLYPPPVTYHDMDPAKLQEVKDNGKKCPR